ncbi:MAG: GPR1/FUN34/YaaH family transporter [Candidatus Gastranaerophilaceae bacterium]|jgi:hypothetical protein
MSELNQIKQWSNPMPAGLVALAVSCFCFFALLADYVKAESMPLLGCWLIGGFVVQLVVGLIDLRNENKTGGNTFLFFSAFFMLVGGIEMIYKFHMLANHIVFDGRIDGWAWMVLTIVLLLWTPAFFKAPFFLTLTVLAIDVALPFITLLNLEVLPAAFKPIPAYALLVAAIFAIYLASAMVVNKAFGKQIYPMPDPIIK